MKTKIAVATVLLLATLFSTADGGISISVPSTEISLGSFPMICVEGVTNSKPASWWTMLCDSSGVKVGFIDSGYCPIRSLEWEFAGSFVDESLGVKIAGEGRYTIKIFITEDDNAPVDGAISSAETMPFNLVGTIPPLVVHQTPDRSGVFLYVSGKPGEWYAMVSRPLLTGEWVEFTSLQIYSGTSRVYYPFYYNRNSAFFEAVKVESGRKILKKPDRWIRTFNSSFTRNR